MRRLLVFLIPFVLFAQAKKPKQDHAKELAKLAASLNSGSYCAAGLTFMPETNLQSVARIFTGKDYIERIHVAFPKNCGPLDHWILHISDINSATGTLVVRTLNETPAGMDIEAYRGHWIDWRVATR